MDKQPLEKFGDRIRLRVCGVCFRDEQILLINHKGLYGHDFWAPPGGGVEFGEPAEAALRREFVEECNSDIVINAFLFGCEFIRFPLHAVELFYEVKLLGQPRIGRDPEMRGRPIISELRFFTPSEVIAIPAFHLHGIFHLVNSPLGIKDLRGFFTLV